MPCKTCCNSGQMRAEPAYAASTCSHSDCRSQIAPSSCMLSNEHTAVVPSVAHTFIMHSIPHSHSHVYFANSFAVCLSCLHIFRFSQFFRQPLQSFGTLFPWSFEIPLLGCFRRQVKAHFVQLSQFLGQLNLHPTLCASIKLVSSVDNVHHKNYLFTYFLTHSTFSI